MVRYVHGGAVTYPPGATFGPRKLGDYELVWIIEGQVVYHADGEDYPCPPGSMVMARPGFHDGFTWDPKRPTRHAYFHFNTDAIPEDWPPPNDWPIVRTMPDDDIVRPLFRYILRYCRTVTPHTPTPLEPMLVRAIETLIGAFVTGPVSQAWEHDRAYPEPVLKAVRFMQQSLRKDAANQVHLEDIASAASVSGEHLCRLFRATFDTGPMEAYRSMRLDLAMGLLARSNLNIEQIAYRTGFASPYHFSRRFRQAYGQPPTTMRKKIAEGVSPPSIPLIRKMPVVREQGV